MPRCLRLASPAACLELPPPLGWPHPHAHLLPGAAVCAWQRDLTPHVLRDV